MASGLAEALAGVLTKPQDTGWGVGLQTLQAVAPRLMSPYSSTGQNLGYGIGGAILAGLIGGMARRSAQQENEQMSSLAQALIAAPAAERSALVKENPKLSPLALAITGQEQEAAQNLAVKRQEAAVQQAKEMAMERFKALGDAGMSAGAVYDPISLEQNKLATSEAIKRQSALSQARAMIGIEGDKAAEIAKRNLDAKGYNPELRDLEDKTRERFRNDQTAKAFQEVKRNFDIMRNGAEIDSKISDALMTQAFIKIVDPGSVIRGSEVEYTNDATRSRVESMLGNVKGLLSGSSTLTRNDKANLMQVASAAYNSTAENYKALVDPELAVLRQRGGNTSAAPHIPYDPFDFERWKKGYLNPVFKAPDGVTVELVD